TASPAAPADQPTTPTPSAAGSEVLQFIDGSMLHGKLRSMSPTQGIGWEYPAAKELIEFKPANVAWIRFEKPKPVPSQDKPTCRLRFHNGDEVFAKLTSINEEHLELETWF